MVDPVDVFEAAIERRAAADKRLERAIDEERAAREQVRVTTAQAKEARAALRTHIEILGAKAVA